MNRRTFLSQTTSATLLIPTLNLKAQEKKKIRVAVIGDTRRGGYGHGLDTVWLNVPNCQIVAVADPDPKGLAQAKTRLKTDQGFSNYHEMLEKIRPEFVAVCPRHADQHRDMLLAAIESGTKGLYVEKPFCRNPAEADQLVAACRKHDAKLAVAHRNRYHPVLPVIDQMIAKGQIGKVLEIRGRGKGDRRGGGEDLWVLGSHVLNLVHYFGGPARNCSAIMKQDGRPVTHKDVKEGNEGLGPLAGNELHARYEMSRGMVAYFDSIANDQTGNAGFGLQIIGSEGIIGLRCDRDPVAHLIPGSPFKPNDEYSPRPWVRISTAGPGKPEPRKDLEETISHHVGPVQDLIDAVRNGREPLCNVQEGAMVVEMICAVFESHRQNGQTVTIPLKHRGNALASLATP